MKIVRTIGLKDCTQAEIAEMLKDYRQRGYIAKHVTFYSGTTAKLPHNGVMHIFSKENK